MHLIPIIIMASVRNDPCSCILATGAYYPASGVNKPLGINTLNLIFVLVDSINIIVGKGNYLPL